MVCDVNIVCVCVVCVRVCVCVVFVHQQYEQYDDT